mgnify:CR=1 FL=1
MTINVQAVRGAIGSNAFQSTPVSASVATPSVITFSVTQKFSDTFALSADIERTNWASLQSLVVHFDNPAQPPSTEQFHWTNSTMYAIGFDWKFSPDGVLRGGLPHDQTPTTGTFRPPHPPATQRHP